MHPIIYDVAVSVDGFIAGPGGDISAFAHEGKVVDDYMDRLQTYAVAIMGRATYEFGYGFGLEPGANPYPQMRTIVFSRQLVLPKDAAVEVRPEATRDAIETIRRDAGGPVYLCGGGAFASALLAMGQVQRLRLKRAPILLGAGTPLFRATHGARMTCEETRDYGAGTLFQSFRIAH